MVESLKQGQIWVSDQRPGSPVLAGKVRPVVVVQDDHVNLANPQTVIVVPLTSQIEPGKAYLRPVIQARDKLLLDSQVMVDQVCAVDRRKLRVGPLASLAPEEWTRVRLALVMVLGLV